MVEPVPAGIEKLLCLAALDARLQTALCERPLDVADAAGIALTATETTLLRSLVPDDIRCMAARVPLPALPHRHLFQQVLDAALVTLGLAVLGCSNPPKPVLEKADATPPFIAAPVNQNTASAKQYAWPKREDFLGQKPKGRKKDGLYGLRGPQVMPDPHLVLKPPKGQELSRAPGLRSILELDEPLSPDQVAPPEELRPGGITIGGKVIHNDKYLDAPLPRWPRGKSK